MTQGRRDALIAEYREVSSNFKLLTDIRFKLLGFLPLAAAATAAVKSDSLGLSTSVLSLFGLAVTIGLMTYNSRNDQLYDALVGRAREIERCLGIPDGAFANRPTSWLSLRVAGCSWRVQHSTGVGVIYSATTALWLYGVLAPALEFVRNVYLQLDHRPILLVAYPTAWVQMLALGASIIIAFSVGMAIQKQQAKRRKHMRDQAATAVELAIATDLKTLTHKTDLLNKCKDLANDTDIDAVKRRAHFMAALDSESLAHFALTGTPELSAAGVVAYLSNLPQRWVYECYAQRRGGQNSTGLSDLLTTEHSVSRRL